MMITNRAVLAIAVGGLLLGLIESTASAEPTKKDDQYGYIFQDDALRGDTLGGGGPQITVIKVGRRDRLLRPRVHFVTEMLASVENL